MSEGKDEIAGTMEWGRLIEEARMALSTLRAGDLEELAGRAERMFGESVRGTQRRGKPKLFGANLSCVTAQHRLLGNLLIATQKNLEVLRRMHTEARDERLAERGNLPWAR